MYNKEAYKRYYKKHKEKIIARQSKWNKEKWKDYYLDYQNWYYIEVVRPKNRDLLLKQYQNANSDQSKRLLTSKDDTCKTLYV